MGRHPTTVQWVDLCDELVATANRLKAEGPELMLRARDSGRDGYPTSTLSGGGAGKGGHGDPVGDLAVALLNNDHDPIGRAVDQMVSSARRAVETLREADSARARALPPAASAEASSLNRCAVHARYGLDAPVRSCERCRWCNDWRTVNGCDPPESAIRALEERRVERDVRRAA